jgi:EAL domain-containing protein (putative c-di-GMP-specific phosphodiesterase class I)
MSRDESCRAIVEIVIDLAHKLNLRSVAEGVEDAATFDAVMDLRCDAAQGYYLSRPVPPEGVPVVLSEHLPSRPAVPESRSAGPPMSLKRIG